MRIYQLLRQIAARHDVTLLSYARPEDRDGVVALSREMAVHVVERTPASQGAKRVAQLRSAVSTRPFAATSVYSPEMQRAIDDLCRTESFDIAQLEASVLCGFTIPAGIKVVLDEHNIEYEVFQRMYEGETSLARRSFSRLEYVRFRRFEQRCWKDVDGCALTSEREAPVLREHAPATATAVVPNAVDLRYFTPGPGPVEPRTVVFNGALYYRPNLEAAHYLVDEIWPLIVDRCPHARLTIVGGVELADLRRLRRPGVVLTGEVPDIRPYVHRAAVVAVPIRMGGGTRLKVVEALATGKAIVSTSVGCEGIAVQDGEHLLLGDDPQTFAARVLALFEDPGLRQRLGEAGRDLAERRYSWDLAGERLEALYTRVAGGSARPVKPAAVSAAA